MTLALAGILVVLALIDSTSIGTLVIPLWLLATPGRLRPDRVLLFLATVVLFYFAVGLAILWGAGWAIESIVAAVDSPIGAIVLLAAGAALVVWSFALERQAKRQKAEGVVVSGRVRRWRERAVGGDGGAGALIALALTATTIELGSMLPYLGAIGSITASGIEWPLSAAVLAGYCLVMVLPALGLLVVRVVAAGRIEPALSRLESWLTRSASATLSWVVGILGVLLIVRAFNGGLSELLP